MDDWDVCLSSSSSGSESPGSRRDEVAASCEDIACVDAAPVTGDDVDPWGIESSSGTSSWSSGASATASSADVPEARQLQPCSDAPLAEAAAAVKEGDVSEPSPKRAKQAAKRYDTELLPSLRTMPLPAFLPGTEWWAKHVWNAVSCHAARLPLKPYRAVVIDSFCCGMASEAFAAKALLRYYSAFTVAGFVRFGIVDLPLFWSSRPVGFSNLFGVMHRRCVVSVQSLDSGGTALSEPPVVSGNQDCVSQGGS